MLGYWKMRGQAQPIRYLLAYLEVNYQEEGYETDSRDAWTNVKDNLGLDFPNQPYLFHEDLKVTEPLAII